MSVTTSLPKLLTIKQAATQLGFSSRQVRRWVDKKLLPAARFGRSLRIAENDLALFITTQKYT